MILSSLFLAAVLSSPAAQQDTIRVHEWGVVVYGDSVVATGSSRGPWYDPREMVTYAPVVYFYGPEFTGAFTVCSLGRIFNVWPEPDEAGGPLWDGGGLGSCVRWVFSAAVGEYQPGETWRSVSSQVPGFDWAMQYWRLPEPLLLSRAADSWADEFLYYEIDFSHVGFPLTLEGLASESTPREDLVSGRVLVFHRSDSGDISTSLVRADSLDAPFGQGHPSEAPYSCLQVTDVLEEWSEGTLSAVEVQAMWRTWEPYVLWGDWEGEYLALFPLPESLVGKISILRLENDQGYPVDYSRFFVGITRLPWRSRGLTPTDID